jgi:hypothetical protein
MTQNADSGRVMKFAYADPPYLGSCALCKHNHPDGRCWDEIESWCRLLDELHTYYDGWALSCATSNLRAIYPMCPLKARIAAWCRPQPPGRLNIFPTPSWEPVIVVVGRKKRSKGVDRVVDHLVLQPDVGFLAPWGEPGNKPPGFARWVFRMMGAEPGDKFDDLFPGSGAVTRAWDAYAAQGALALSPNDRSGTA